ncbi:MAG: hypothetical protein HY649_01855 [Acidobacteria bacterium]|nr:hypothetical protein [Acidobacteriota bacterium]
MPVYILGAGASHHAGYPLAAQLGSALKTWTESSTDGAKHRSVITQLEECGDLSDLEGLLTSIVAERGVESPFYVKDAIRDFFWSLRSKDAPGYSAFAKNRVAPGDVILTFNYDSALERQLKLAEKWEVWDGYGFPIGEKTAASSKVKVLKLHGSVNWQGLQFGGFTEGAQRVDDVLGTRPVIWGRDFKFLGYPEGINDPLVPETGTYRNAFILLTYSKKFYFETSFGKEWVPFWDSIWNQAEDALRKADEILMFGYSLPAADERAVSMILEAPRKNAKITIGCHTDSMEIARRFKANGYNHVITTTMKFEDWSG